MLRWIVLLGLIVAGVSALWSTQLPPSVSVDIPNPPTVETAPVPPVQQTVERLFGLWKSPDSHFWSDNLRVGPPEIARDETVPHGPLVAEQAGWTRRIESSTMRSSEWTEFIRRIVIATGVLNSRDKSFATSGVVEKELLNAIVPIPPEEPLTLDGGFPFNPSEIILDGRGPGDEEPFVYSGGGVDGIV